LVNENASAVAETIAAILSDSAEAQRRADLVRERALAAHGLDGLMDRLVGVFQGLKSAI
jgi:hypothetical protein